MHQLSIFLFAVACLTGLQADFKVPAEKERVAGVWSFRTNAGDAKLNGIVTVWKDGEVYIVQWSGRGETPEGNKVVVQLAGVGLFADDVLAISWGEPKGHGVSLFRIDGKNARGRWCPGSGSRVVEETWVKVAEHKE